SKSGARSKLAMRRPISCAAALSSALRSKPIWRSADLCWSIRTIASSRIRWRASGMTSRALAGAREERERARQRDQIVLGNAVCRQLLATTIDFREVWDRQSTPNRERKRLLAYIVEDVTMIKIPAERIAKIHVRFKRRQP